MRTRLTDLLQIEHPVMLAGMGGVSYHQLVAAVSNAGGIGTLGAAAMESEQMVREKHGLRVHLLSDPEKKALTAYGAWGMKNMYGRQVEGVIRSTVLIDPKGVVAHHWKTVRAEGHAKHVKERLAELQEAK